MQYPQQSQNFLPFLNMETDLEVETLLKPPISPQPRLQLTELIKKLKQQNLAVTPLNPDQLLEVSKSKQLSLIQSLPYLGNNKEESDKIRREQPFTKFKHLTELNTEFASKFKSTFQKLQQTSSGYKFGATFFKASVNQLSEESGNYDDIRNSISIVKSIPHRDLQLSLLHNKVNMEQQQTIENQRIQEYEIDMKKQLKQSAKLKKIMNKRMNIFPINEHSKIQMKHLSINKTLDNDTCSKKQTNQEIQPDQALNYQSKISCFFYYTTNTNFGPNSREGSTMFTLGNKIYLIGGMGVSCVEDVYQLDVNKNVCYWKRLQIQCDNIQQIQIFARLNHTVCIHKNQVIIFGGEMVTNKGLQRVRECTNETKIINFVTLQSRSLNFSNYIEPRKGHVAVIIGKNMLVHGGINRQGQYLREIIVLDLINLKWNTALFQQGDFYKKGVSFHACCSIINQFNRTIEIYQKKTQNSYITQREGVLFFGGVDSQGETYEQLKILVFDNKPMYFELLKTSGIAPKGRSKHIMNHHESLGLVIISGGFSSDGVFLNELAIFDLKFMTWMQVQTSGKQFVGRCGHSATLMDSRIYIFGGYNENGFLSAEVVVGEFDNNKNTEKIKIVKGREGYNPHAERQIQKQKVLTLMDSSRFELQQQTKFTERDALIKKLQFRTDQSQDGSYYHLPHTTLLFEGMLKSNLRYPSLRKINIQEFTDQDKGSIGQLKRKNSIQLVSEK